ncbi:MAG: hypothetical protein IJ415_01170 [Clostridia bacterium]|nr:hypothetical protein [Clostridia bacterium]
MDINIINELYEIYKIENYFVAQEKFDEAYKKYQINGKKNLLKTLEDYINSQVKDFSNFFISNKDEKCDTHKVVSEIANTFESLVMPIVFHFPDVIEEDIFSSDIKQGEALDYSAPVDAIKPHDLFTIDLKFLDEAYELYSSLDKENYEHVKNLIIYVKKNKLLDKLYVDNSWREIDFEELINALYDVAKDKKVFKAINEAWPENNHSLFNKIKVNCDRISSIKFEKYRPQLNSSKQIRANYGKLIFCKNLLMFYETGIMPTYDAMIDCLVGELDFMKLIEEIRNLYSKHFDETTFRAQQGNFICKPEIYLDGYRLEFGKKVKLDNRLIIGFLISCGDDFSAYSTYKIPYLIHINIEDVNNDCSNYEIQLNLLPNGKLEHRLQLMRLDNWESEQPHKNVAKKLATTTHIHLYNEFDLIRGKVNGNFDIAYNLEAKSTDFKTSLKTFLKILDLDKNIQKNIYDSTIKSIEEHKSSIKTAESSI